MKQKKCSCCKFMSWIIFKNILIILLCNSTGLSAFDSNTDKESLLAFESSIQDPQNTLSGWNRSVSHCIWPGITCSASGSRVTSINLSGFGLSGTIPSHLSNLTSLQMLNLNNNSFYGHIPSSLENLSSLQTFILANNAINGTIPSSLSMCHNLERISLEFNQLSGSLPDELGNLGRLRFLNVAVNNLTGIIPRSFGNLSALTSLSLSRNSLSGELWDELRGLRNISFLQLSENRLTGEFPAWLFNISSLEYISLTKNNLAGKLPSGTYGVNTTNLGQLYLSENSITGTIPSFIIDSSNIQYLDLSRNKLEGSIPMPRNLKELRTLHLGYNNLSSTTAINAQLFGFLGNSTKLEILFLNSNFLSGELPSSIGNLSLSLRELCLDSNLLTGIFPDELTRYQNLTALSIFQNTFSGNFPVSIGKSSNLQRIQAHQNNFSGGIPGSFWNLTQLFMLTLGRNKLSGSIPIGISGCKQLAILGLITNQLSGNIPKEMFGLYNLRNLRLGSNKFTGPIPSEVGTMKQLEALDMSGNYLLGSIPSSIGGCSSLQELDLSRNNLSRQIPDAMGDLLGLESLDLSHNNLSGTIPVDLEKLATLKSVNLSFNNLEGQVPRNGAFVNVTWEDIQGNDNLCGSDRDVAQNLRISECDVKSSSKHHLIAILIPVSISALLFVCAIIGLVWIRKKQRGGSEGQSYPLVKGLPMKISYDKIREATGDFAPENFLGKGGFGSVYRGTFTGRASKNASGTGEHAVILAVKVIDLDQSKALKSFNAECDALKHARHRNLVKVVTSCSSVDHKGADFKALVMEFMCNGNLERWLYPGPDDGLNLGLIQRLNIAIDVASAVEYLHSDCEPPIVHSDLKPGNVLLDEHFTARVGDFGLARFLTSQDQKEDVESSTVKLKGSIGYIAPEYGMGQRVSTSGDVYSFGILLLELLIARKPTDEKFQEGLNMNKFASAINENHYGVLRIVDMRLFSNYGMHSNEIDSRSSFISSQDSRDSISIGSSNVDQLRYASSQWSIQVVECVAELIRIGLSCASQSPKDRPAMRDTLIKLHEVKKRLLGSVDTSCSNEESTSASV